MKFSQLKFWKNKNDDGRVPKEIILRDRRSSTTWRITKVFGILAVGAVGYASLTSDWEPKKVVGKNKTHIDMLNCQTNSSATAMKSVDDADTSLAKDSPSITEKAESEKAKIAVLKVHGGIGADYQVDNFRTILQQIIDDGGFDEIALKIESPGGPAYNTFDIFDLLKQVQACGIETNSFVDAYAFSGGYVAALAGEKIYARHPYSEVGSVGVILTFTAYSELMEKIGVESRVYKTGPVKGGPNPMRPETTEQTEEILKGLEKLQQVFWGMVEKERGSRLTSSKEDILAGGTFYADDAKQMGMIDDIGSIDQIMADKYPKGFEYVFFEPMKDTRPTKGLLDRLSVNILGKENAENIRNHIERSGQFQLLHLRH